MALHGFHLASVLQLVEGRERPLPQPIQLLPQNVYLHHDPPPQHQFHTHRRRKIVWYSSDMHDYLKRESARSRFHVCCFVHALTQFVSTPQRQASRPADEARHENPVHESEASVFENGAAEDDAVEDSARNLE